MQRSHMGGPGIAAANLDNIICRSHPPHFPTAPWLSVAVRSVLAGCTSVAGRAENGFVMPVRQRSMHLANLVKGVHTRCCGPLVRMARPPVVRVRVPSRMWLAAGPQIHRATSVRDSSGHRAGTPPRVGPRRVGGRLERVTSRGPGRTRLLRDTQQQMVNNRAEDYLFGREATSGDMRRARNLRTRDRRDTLEMRVGETRMRRYPPMTEALVDAPRRRALGRLTSTRPERTLQFSEQEPQHPWARLRHVNLEAPPDTAIFRM